MPRMPQIWTSCVIIPVRLRLPRAAPGRHDREAARAKPAQPAGSAVMAASVLRKLAPALFQKVLRFGEHSNQNCGRSAVVGKALQMLCICAKRGLPTPEERRV